MAVGQRLGDLVLEAVAVAARIGLLDFGSAQMRSSRRVGRLRGLFLGRAGAREARSASRRCESISPAARSVVNDILMFTLAVPEAGLLSRQGGVAAARSVSVGGVDGSVAGGVAPARLHARPGGNRRLVIRASATPADTRRASRRRTVPCRRARTPSGRHPSGCSWQVLEGADRTETGRRILQVEHQTNARPAADTV